MNEILEKINNANLEEIIVIQKELNKAFLKHYGDIEDVWNTINKMESNELSNTKNQIENIGTFEIDPINQLLSSLPFEERKKANGAYLMAIDTKEKRTQRQK